MSEIEKLVADWQAHLSAKLRGPVHSSYSGGGWVESWAHNLPAHPGVAHIYPTGWSMLDRSRTGKIRMELLAARYAGRPVEL